MSDLHLSAGRDLPVGVIETADEADARKCGTYLHRKLRAKRRGGEAKEFYELTLATAEEVVQDARDFLRFSHDTKRRNFSPR